jgi:hypothetical protein
MEVKKLWLLTVHKITEIAIDIDSDIDVIHESCLSESSSEDNGDFSESLDNSCQPGFSKGVTHPTPPHHSTLYYQSCSAVHSQETDATWLRST